MKSVIIGTAGHIDHGKTSLIKALNGFEGDSLKEEQERQITINLSFSNLKLKDKNISFIDVPGHKDLVKTMVSGAFGFSVCLFVVDINEGLKEQSLEHLEILKILDIKNIILVLSKCDLCENIEQKSVEILEELKNLDYPILKVFHTSIKNNQGIEELKNYLYTIENKENDEELIFHYYIDRVFSLKGIGTVVTGSLNEGSITLNEKIICLDTQKERDELSLKIYENFAQFGIDCLQNQNTTKEKILNKVNFINENFLIDALALKRPIIFTTAHYGNWEILSLAYAAKYGAISIVGKKLKSETMYEILSQSRTQFDIELIDKKGGIRQMLSALKKERALGILTDQDCVENESIRLKFFNKEVNYQMGASLIAQRSNALIIPVYAYKEDGKFCIEFFKAKDSQNASLEELTLYQAQSCEEMIKKRPWEYFFFHRRFASYNQGIYP
ncbi:lipid A biosynthesis lauroyl acyltransferase [Campylobacter jejuni]|uniref:lipid A biosynthesis lauroyl acyltransferase n=1 Tax=Campylobacter jejuni TaxID=197 RepID=UPI00227E55D9|nr:lipid A biosynthesis lauroyl acyltransferase [Campylobacter jejuni]